MAHLKSGSGHLPQKFRKIRNVMDKPDPYMAWKDDRSLLTQETKKKKGVIKVGDLGKKAKTTANVEGLKKIRQLFATKKRAERQQFSNQSPKNKNAPMPSLHTRSPY